MREDCGNGGPVESVEKQKQLFPSFHRPLEISQKRRDSHIPTAPGGGPKLKPKTGREEDDGRGRGTMLMQRNTYRQAILPAAGFQPVSGVCTFCCGAGHRFLWPACPRAESRLAPLKNPPPQEAAESWT